jgi:HlyD family secretion protein
MNKPAQFKQHDDSSRKPATRGKIRLKTAVGIFVVGVLIIGGCLVRAARQGSAVSIQGISRCRVERGNLLISVLQSGELEAKRSESITNDTDREAKIIHIVDDGARVSKGELIVELESEELKNRLLQNQSDVSRAEAELRNAQEELEIRRLKHETDHESAKLRVELAKLEIKKYTEAEYPQRVDKAILEITYAKEELSRAKDKLEWTTRLVEREYASRQDLDTAKLEVQRKEIEVRNREVDLRILQEYTNKKELKEKENEVSKAEAEVDRLVKTYESEKARNEANLEARKTSLEVQRRQLKKIEEQVEKTRVLSQWDGQVFYPKRNPWDTRKIEKGASVFPRQQILQFPDLSAWNIKAGVPESIIDKIRPGQRALATLDALPGVILEAIVDRVSVVPDQTRWYDSGSKTYTVTLDIPTTPTIELKPGMSAAVEVITGKLTDVLYTPIQAVLSEEDRHYVFLVEGGTARKIQIKVGENNENNIRILEGLQEGQELLLYAPVEAETRAGLKERPLDRAKKAGMSVEPAESNGTASKAPAAAETTDASAPATPQASQSRPGQQPPAIGEARPAGGATDGTARPQRQPRNRTAPGSENAQPPARESTP